MSSKEEPKAPSRLLERYMLLNAMIADADLKRSDLRVATCLLAHWNAKTGLTYPSLETIVAEAGVDRSTAIRAARCLVQRGFLEVVHERGGRGRSNTYRLAFEKVSETVAAAPPFEAETVAATRPFDAETVAAAPPFEAETVAYPSVNGGLHATRTQSLTQKEESAPVLLPGMLPIADAMLDIWKEELGHVLTVPRSLNGGRRGAAVRRLQEDLGGDLEAWRALCRRIKTSAFLTGGGAKGWRATFDWALEPRNLACILEGNFDDRPAAAKPAASVAKPNFQNPFDRQVEGRINHFLKTGEWDWEGPAPDQPGCKVPRYILDKFPSLARLPA